jgi:hypothetical protein
MSFQEMLLAAIESSEIPLRFEPGAGDAVAKPVTEMLRAWILAHMPPDGSTDFEAGWTALTAQLLSEMDGQ